jgi:hypothetical protein
MSRCSPPWRRCRLLSAVDTASQARSFVGATASSFGLEWFWRVGMSCPPFVGCGLVGRLRRIPPWLFYEMAATR